MKTISFLEQHSQGQIKLEDTELQQKMIEGKIINVIPKIVVSSFSSTYWPIN